MFPSSIECSYTVLTWCSSIELSKESSLSSRAIFVDGINKRSSDAISFRTPLIRESYLVRESVLVAEGLTGGCVGKLDSSV